MRKLTSGEKRYDLRDVIGGTQRSNKMANREDRLEDSESSDNVLDESSDSTGTYDNESGNSDAEVERGPIPCRYEPVRVRQNGEQSKSEERDSDREEIACYIQSGLNCHNAGLHIA